MIPPMKSPLIFLVLLLAGTGLALDPIPPHPRDQTALQLHESYLLRQATISQSITDLITVILASEDPAVKIKAAPLIEALLKAQAESETFAKEALVRASQAERPAAPVR